MQEYRIGAWLVMKIKTFCQWNIFAGLFMIENDFTFEQ